MFGTTDLFNRMMVSNEAEDVSGRTSAEIERVLYARLGNFDFLKQANAADHQEQWSVKVAKTDENAGSGSIRVRKVINLREPSAPIQYVLATKLDIGEKGSSAETPEPSTADQFRIFKYLGNKGMVKDRYYFDIDGTDLRWEVDCFAAKNGTGLYNEWVKIDLEKWPRGKALPQLPFEVLELIDGSPGYLTDENKAKVDELYQQVFLTSNEMNPLMTYEEEAAPEDPNATGAATDEEGQKKDNDKGSPDATQSEQSQQPEAADGAGTGGNQDDGTGADGQQADGTGTGAGDDDQ